VRLFSATARHVPDGVAGEDYGANQRRFVTDVGLPFWAGFITLHRYSYNLKTISFLSTKPIDRILNTHDFIQPSICWLTGKTKVIYQRHRYSSAREMFRNIRHKTVVKLG
jgi:hypothetical protein